MTQPIEQLDASRKLSICADDLAFIQKSIPAQFQQKLQGLIHDMNVLAAEMCPVEEDN